MSRPNKATDNHKALVYQQSPKEIKQNLMTLHHMMMHINPS